jgi:hypothetical protein
MYVHFVLFSTAAFWHCWLPAFAICGLHVLLCEVCVSVDYRLCASTGTGSALVLPVQYRMPVPLLEAGFSEVQVVGFWY